MFTIDTDKTISITRGDSGSFVAPIDYALQLGDVLRFKVFRKKACEDVVLQKDFAIEEATNTVTLELTEKDTRIGEIISKPVDYWYEIELNPENNPQTLVGYDDDGAKIFRLYPEGRDLEDDELTEEEKDTFRKLSEEFFEEEQKILEETIAEYKAKVAELEKGAIKVLPSGTINLWELESGLYKVPSTTTVKASTSETLANPTKNYAYLYVSGRTYTGSTDKKYIVGWMYIVSTLYDNRFASKVFTGATYTDGKAREKSTELATMKKLETLETELKDYVNEQLGVIDNGLY